MFAHTLLYTAVLSVLAARGAVADFSVNSTAFTQCGSTHITWSGTSKAVNILLVPADEPCDGTLYDLGDHTKSSMSWNVALPAGTELMISVEDEAGDEAWSDTITVGNSTDSSCLTAAQRAALPAAPAASAASSVAAGASTSTSATAALANAAKETPASGSSGSGSGSTSAGALGAANAGIGPKVSGAGRAGASLALAGAMAFAGAALL